MKKRYVYPALILLFYSTHFNPFNGSTKITGSIPPSGPALYTYEIVERLPHDPQAFTQGLVYKDGYFYEGTGLYGHSSLRQVNPADGTVLRQVNLPEAFFGEGITIYQDRIIQLTWQEYRAFVYDLASFSLLDTFSYDTEGWGITSDGKHLIMSDGSSLLTYLDPATFKPVQRLSVQSNGEPVTRLNELEFINGKIFANVWLTNRIAIIDPASGQVTAWLDLTGLLDPKDHPGHTVDVLNGIAYDEKEDRLFVTGKWWPFIFEIKIVEQTF
ncbi:MAG: glutaminyl-peptide cyclotransferase [Firmicutes bacterium]|nr:glutaminyl-peptide cyclotransferase [Bacillota bacterium]